MGLIREYRDDDAPQLRECFVELQECEKRIDPHLADGEAVADKYLAYMFSRGAETGGKVFIAEEDGRVAGFVSVWAKVRNRAVEEIVYEYAYVSDLVVLPGYRGRGLGRALLSRAEDYAREQGATLLRIAVMSGNDGAQRLYESFGFKYRVLEMTKPL